MGEKDTIPVRCAEHMQNEEEIYTRIEKIEERLLELQELISKKADEAEMNRRLTELLDMVQSLQDSNLRHTEALAGIRAVLDAIKETQRDFKDEMEQSRKGRELEFVTLDKNFGDLSSNFTELSKTMYSMNTLIMSFAKPIPVSASADEEEDEEKEVRSVKRGLVAILRDYLKTPAGATVFTLILLILAILLVKYTPDLITLFAKGG